MGTRYWVGGTGNWDAATTTNWASSSGGASGSPVPTSADDVIFDAASGGGTCTPTVDITIRSLTCGAFTGTIDWSANNKNVTLNLVTSGFNGSGTGTRTINMGNGTWTIAGNLFSFSTATNLTFNANSSTLIFSGGLAGLITFATGGKTFNNVTLNASTGGYSLTGAGTISGTFTTNNCSVLFPSATTFTIGTWVKSSSSASPVSFLAGTAGSVATISSANTPAAMDWMAIRSITFTGGGTFVAPNSFDLGGNTGVTITAPSGGAARMIGG